MGSIVFNNTTKKVYFGSTPVKKIYQGSTLIWSAQTYNHSWSPIYKNTSTTAEPAFVGSDGTITLEDSNGNVVAQKSNVTIPSRGGSVDVGAIDFTASDIYTSLTAKFSYQDNAFSTSTVTFSPSSGTYLGTPVSVSFSFD